MDWPPLPPPLIPFAGAAGSRSRASLLRDLFDPSGDGIGMTLARITIATSDFTPPPFYSYDDGAADAELQRFSVEKDEAFVLPAIKEALSAAGVPGTDTLRLFASPWSAPGWMKDSGVMSGGKLKPENNALYAKYLLRFIVDDRILLALHSLINLLLMINYIDLRGIASLVEEIIPLLDTFIYYFPFLVF